MNVKHIILLFILFSLAASVSAQTEKGNWLIGGESSLSSSILGTRWLTDDYDETGASIEFDLSPRAGFFIMDNFVLGTEIGLELSSSTEDDRTDIYNLFTGSAFARYYFGSKKIKPFVGAGIGGGRSSFKVYDTDDRNEELFSSKSNVFIFDIGGGASFFLNKSVAIDLGLSFDSYAQKNIDDETKWTERGLVLDVGFSIFL